MPDEVNNREMQKLAGPAGAFRVGPIRPPSEASSLLLQVTRGCTWNRCRFCNIYRDTTFKAFDADSVKRDIDTIAAYAEIIREYRRPDGSWDLNGLNYRLGLIGGPGERADAGAPATEPSCAPAEEGPEAASVEDRRQSFYMVAQWLVNGGENVFLQDGNTTALSSGRLADVLIYLKQTFPGIRRITSYGRAAELSRHDADYYAELKEAGLDRIHSGFESGSDKVLTLINKGCTSEQEIAAGRAVKAGGIELSVYFMPGIGGRELSRENAEETARVINAIDPDFLRIRTAAIKPGTELHEIFFPAQDTSPEAFGSHTLCSDDDKVREIRRVIELADGISTRIVSDHMVNLLQDVQGPMCGPGKAELLSGIDRYLDLPETERRIYQLLRRSLRAYDLDDMNTLLQGGVRSLEDEVSRFSDREWDEKMNAYISRYI